MEKQKKSPAVLAGLYSIGTSQNNVPKATRPEKTPLVRFSSRPSFVLSTEIDL